MKIFFFKRPKPRQFNYRPLYYDPDQEEAEERRKIREGLSSSDPKERLRAEFRRRWHTQPQKRDNTGFVIRIIFYSLITFLSVYLIFFTDFINRLVSLFLR